MIDGTTDDDGGYFNNRPALPVVTSPDGAQFFVITRCGDFERDESVFRLRVYSAASILDAVLNGRPAPAPLREIEMRSQHGLSSYLDPLDLSRPYWADNEKIYFETMEQLRGRVWRNWLSLSVSTGVIQRQASIPLGQFERAARIGQTIGIIDRRENASVYVSFMDIDANEALAPVQTQYPSLQITPALANSILRGGISKPGRRAVFVSRNGLERQLADVPESLNDPVSAAIRPGGREAILFMPSESNEDSGRFTRVNLERTTSHVMALAGPRTFRGQFTVTERSILWSSDGRRAVLVNAVPPGEEPGLASVLSYDANTGDMSVIAPIMDGQHFVRSASWAGETLILVRATRQITGRQGRQGRQEDMVAYRFIEGGWRSVDVPPRSVHEPRRQDDIMNEQRLHSKYLNPLFGYDASFFDFPAPQPIHFPNGLEIFLEENPNAPQKLVARSGESSLTISRVDPALESVSMAQTQMVEWRTHDGQLHRGLLTLPLHSSSSPPPLVFQIYKYMPNVWRPDGYVPTGFARQALAARGMAVFEMSLEEAPLIPHDWAHEIGAELPIVEAAIDELARLGLIDTFRLGVIGFSRSGFHARQFLTHPGRYSFIAAVANDSFSNAYGSAMAGATVVNLDSAYRLQYLDPVGGQLPHRDWASWTRNADDLGAAYSTGALLDIHHNLSAGQAANRFMSMGGAYRSAGRPYQMVLIPGGAHMLQRPMQRYASLSLNVDWMDFWLKDHEDPNPAKREQYTRWRQIRTDWELWQAWEAAGHPIGSIPDANFQIPAPAAKH